MARQLERRENDTVICARLGCYKRSLRRANLCMICEADYVEQFGTRSPRTDVPSDDPFWFDEDMWRTIAATMSTNQWRGT